MRSCILLLVAQRWRFGYRRIHVLTRRKGLVVNCKRVQRIYREERLQATRGKRRRGLPQVIRTNQGPEFTCNALNRWAYRDRVPLRLIQAGKPTPHAYVESFNGKLRNERLNEHCFRSLAEAREIIGTRQAASEHLASDQLNKFEHGPWG